MLYRRLSAWIGVVALAAGAMFGQAPPRTRIIGAITGTTAEGAVVKTDAGESVPVVFLPETKFQKVAPGEKDLSKAQTIGASDLAAGDRVLVRGAGSPDAKTFTAQSVVLMSAREIAQKNEKERAEWTRRGLAGIVVSLDPAAKEVHIRIPSMFGQQHEATVAVTDNTRYRRYAPDSVRFADAKPSSLGELKPGDQLRARGEKNEDGTRIVAEEVVSGEFVTVAGSVTTCDAAANEVRIKDLRSGKMMTVKVTPDSVLRKLPQFPMARMGGGAPGGGTAGAAGAGAGGGGMRRGGGDMQQMLEHMPATTLAEIQPGETIVVASTRGATPEHLTAVTLLAGADALIAMSQAAASRGQGQHASAGGQAMGNWNLGDVSMIPMP